MLSKCTADVSSNHRLAARARPKPDKRDYSKKYKLMVLLIVSVKVNLIICSFNCRKTANCAFTGSVSHCGILSWRRRGPAGRCLHRPPRRRRRRRRTAWRAPPPSRPPPSPSRPAPPCRTAGSPAAAGKRRSRSICKSERAMCTFFCSAPSAQNHARCHTVLNRLGTLECTVANCRAVIFPFAGGPVRITAKKDLPNN